MIGLLDTATSVLNPVLPTSETSTFKYWGGALVSNALYMAPRNVDAVGVLSLPAPSSALCGAGSACEAACGQPEVNIGGDPAASSRKRKLFSFRGSQQGQPRKGHAKTHAADAK